jgi:hypothetical protein
VQPNFGKQRLKAQLQILYPAAQIPILRQSVLRCCLVFFSFSAVPSNAWSYFGMFPVKNERFCWRTASIITFALYEGYSSFAYFFEQQLYIQLF